MEGEPIRLTTREFAIAWLLFSRPGEYASRRHIAGAVWSSSEDIVGRTLEQHIYKLRKKLDLSGQHGIHLRTMYAHGYRVEMAEVKEVDPESSPLAPAPSNVTPLAVRPEKTERAPHHAACAEIHPADSETARNAPSWPDPAAAAVRAACGTGTAKAMCLTWPEVSRSPYRRGS